MTKTLPFVTATALLALGPPAAAATVDELQAAYRQQGAAIFSAAAGATLWRQAGVEGRRCTTCHGTDLARPGSHERTGKAIEPMAPSANPERYADARKVRKWFLRNCKWTFGRECTAQEKGDLLEYLTNQ